MGWRDELAVALEDAFGTSEDGPRVRAIAVVESVSEPKGFGRFLHCRIVAVVRGAEGPAVRRAIETRAAREAWPVAGQRLPVSFDPRTPRRIEVLWDEIA